MNRLFDRAGLLRGGWLVLGVIVAMHLIALKWPPETGLWDVIVCGVQWVALKLFR